MVYFNGCFKHLENMPAIRNILKSRLISAMTIFIIARVGSEGECVLSSRVTDFRRESHHSWQFHGKTPGEAAYFPTRRKRFASSTSSSSLLRAYAKLFAMERTNEERQCNRTHKENPLRSRGELSIKLSNRKVGIEINRALERARNFNRRQGKILSSVEIA